MAEGPRALLIGDEVPNFTAPAWFPDISEDEKATGRPLNLHDYIDGRWAVFFSHPADFTPVCTTELGEVARLKPEFDSRNTVVLALSVDSAESHAGWVNDIAETQSVEAVNFPIIADENRAISALFGMIHPNAPDTLAGKLTVRSVFVIGPDKKIKLSLTYPASTGRNFNEILRVLDSLQLTLEKQVATPANWVAGQDVVILPSVSNEEATERFPGFRAVKPYLRLTAPPS